MRTLTAWLFGSALFSSIGLGPSGCEGPIETPNTVAVNNSSSPHAADLANPKPRSNQSEIDRYGADPLVPPLQWTDEAEPLAIVDFERPELPPHSPFLPGINVSSDLGFDSDSRAHFHPHGQQVCASGCAVSNHPTPELKRDSFRRLMLQFASEPMDEASIALETLLFHGRQTRALLDRWGDAPLDRRRIKFLRRELKRTHVLVSFRIVDKQGQVRVSMPPTRVPLDRRHVFEMDEKNLPNLVTSGTVKRVGLYHLWTRM